jgi:hypothetical protein
VEEKKSALLEAIREQHLVNKRVLELEIEINTQELIDQLKRAILIAQRYIEKLEDNDDGSLCAAERDWLKTTSDIADLQVMIRAQLYTKKNREE